MTAAPTAPSWLTVFLDYPASDFDAGVRFWRDGTGYDLSAPRGEKGEFATLLPPAGEDFLRVQRLGDGSSRLHLDVHVEDPWAAVEFAEGLGAELVAESLHGYFVLHTPAGFTFCLVHQGGGVVPPSAVWPDGHRSRVSRFCLDVPRKRYEAEVAFFQRLLGGHWIAVDDPETALRPAGDGPLDVRLQPAEVSTGITSHLHLATDDMVAEVARLEALGAKARAIRTGKTILEAPGGGALCVVAVGPDQLA
jgi:hypothetical protein